MKRLMCNFLYTLYFLLHVPQQEVDVGAVAERRPSET